MSQFVLIEWKTEEGCKGKLGGGEREIISEGLLCPIDRQFSAENIGTRRKPDCGQFRFYRRDSLERCMLN